MLSEYQSLLPFNTFHIEATARYFEAIDTEESLMNLIHSGVFTKHQHLIIGGGSNLLFTQDYDGLVVKNNLKGISVVKENDKNVWVQAAGGESWHHLVLFCVGHSYAGIENLSLIPGTVGAAPIQNIGAYGVELMDVFDHLEGVNILTGKKRIFNKLDVRFGYRNSVFKQQLKGKYFITSVTLCLNKFPSVKITYGAIRETLEKMGISEPGIKDVSDAVIRIRKSKLPDPTEIGNAGSFFKNPEIPAEQYYALKKVFEHIPGYISIDDKIKVPAGWLIEQCGWKGKRIGSTGSHKDQALVLVNYGNASGKEIFSLAQAIKQSVNDKFAIDIEMEVNII